MAREEDSQKRPVRCVIKLLWFRMPASGRINSGATKKAYGHRATYSCVVGNVFALLKGITLHMLRSMTAGGPVTEKKEEQNRDTDKVRSGDKSR